VQASVFDDVATMEARTTSLALPRQQAKLARGTKDMEAIAEAVQRPTMKFVATKTADQLDLQALHRLDERIEGLSTEIAALADRDAACKR
jgi:transposase